MGTTILSRHHPWRTVAIAIAVVGLALVVGFVLLVIGGWLFDHTSDSHDQLPKPIECPATAPSSCAHLAALALGVPEASLPKISVPAGVKFTSGGFFSIEGETSWALTFTDRRSPGIGYGLVVNRIDPRHPLRPTNGRVYATGGWYAVRWVSSGTGRHYLERVLNGKVRSYSYEADGFDMMASPGGPSAQTARQNAVLMLLLDNVNSLQPR